MLLHNLGCTQFNMQRQGVYQNRASMFDYPYLYNSANRVSRDLKVMIQNFTENKNNINKKN